jgi:hypothetical protein
MAFLDFINNWAQQQQSVANKPQQQPEKPLCPEAQAKMDAAEQRLARATRFVDTTARPMPAKAPAVKWPRLPASWER